MNKEDLCYTPATELAGMVANKEISPVEVMQTVLERIEALEPKINAPGSSLISRPLRTGWEGPMKQNP